MRNLVGILIFFSSVLGFGQSEYVDIPRTKIAFPKIEGFAVDSVLGVLLAEDNQEEGFMFTDLVGGSFEQNARNFTKENFEKEGLPVTDVRDTIVDGYLARYALVSSDERDVEMIMLVFGSESFSAMVNAFILVDRSEESKAGLKQAFFNLTYDENKVVDYYEGIKFRIESDNQDFLLESAVSSAYIYHAASDTSEKIVVMQLPYMQGQTLLQVAANALLEGQSQGWENFVYEAERYCHQDRSTCYAVEGTFFLEGEKKNLYYQFTTDKKEVIIVVLVGISDGKPEILKQGIAFAQGIYITTW